MLRQVHVLYKKERALLASSFCCHIVDLVMILKGVFSFKNGHIMDILLPKSQRMKTCRSHMIYNGVTNNKFNKVYWLKKSIHIQVYTFTKDYHSKDS